MKYFSILLFLALSHLIHAQNVFLEGAVYSTGGSFGGPGNMVKTYFYDHLTAVQNEEAAFLGDFSNDILVDGLYAYIHVGRGFNNPAGADMLVKIDLESGAVLDSTLINVAGLQNMYAHENYIIFNRGFGAFGNYLIALDKNDLSQIVYLDNTIPQSTNGLAIHEDTAYVTYTENDTGKIAVFDLSGAQPAFNSTIAFDTLAAGLQDVVHTGNMLVANHRRFDANFNVMYSGITTYDFQNAPVTDTSINGTVGFFDVYNQEILGNFNFQLQWWNPSTNQYTALNVTNFSDVFYDPVEELFAAQSTDYSSLGEMHLLNANGTEVTSFNTDISGSAIYPVYNHYQRLNDSLISLDAALTLDMNITAVDSGDAVTVHSATIIGSENLPEDQVTFASNELTLINNHSFNIDTVVVNYTDRFNRSYTDTLYLTYNLTSIQSVKKHLKWSVFPNPVKRTLHISQLEDVDLANYTQIQILNSEGALVQKMPTSSLPSISVENLSKGVYYLQLVGTHSTTVKKFVKW